MKTKINPKFIMAFRLLFLLRFDKVIVIMTTIAQANVRIWASSTEVTLLWSTEYALDYRGVG